MELETISYTDLFSDGARHRKAIDRLKGALDDTAFFQVGDIEEVISRPMLERHYALGEKLFSLNEDVLKRYEDLADQRQQGYTPFGIEFGDPRCHWMMGRGTPPYNPNIFPDDILPEYGETSRVLFAGFDLVLTKVAWAIEEALGLPPGALRERLENGDDRMRHLLYRVGSRGGQAATAHGDIDALTGLCPRERGLRVCPKGGVLTPIDVLPGHMVVNTGEQLTTLLKTWFNIDVPFTQHDVVLPPGTPVRQSLVYFKHFHWQVIVDMLTGMTAPEFTRDRLGIIGHPKA